ncbi:MAG: YhcN/YlaJ family sporulation lipoprotein [Bacillota bacterium]
MKKILSLVLILSITLVFIGCGKTSPPIKPRPEHRPKATQQITIDPQRAEEVKATARKAKEVEDSAAVVVDQDIAVAVKVSGFNRLRIKSIRDQARQRIKAANPGFHVYLTSDKKLFKQLSQLEKDARRPNPSLEEFKARVNKVISDM